MHESDLRELFQRQAATDLLPAPISIPAARRTGRLRLFLRRAGTFGTPVLAAAAVVAVLLVGPFAAAPRQPSPGNGLPAAPKLFNPLVPYAAVTWLPYRATSVGTSDWHTALLLEATSVLSPAERTEAVLYPAGWCTPSSASLVCGSTAAGTRIKLTVTGTAPDVQGQPAYWTKYAGGNLNPMRPQAGRTTAMVAFQYARGGWAVVESSSTPADVIRIAGSLVYGQTAPLRFPFRLTGLPRQWSEVLLAQTAEPGPAGHGPSQFVLFLGSPATRPGTAASDLLTVLASTAWPPQLPRCQTQTKVVGSGQASPPRACPSVVINGSRAYLNENPPVAGKQTLLAADPDGLYVYLEADSQGAPLTPTEVFAHHIQLLGLNPADWTASPGASTRLTNP